MGACMDRDHIYDEIYQKPQYSLCVPALLWLGIIGPETGSRFLCGDRHLSAYILYPAYRRKKECGRLRITRTNCIYIIYRLVYVYTVHNMEELL